MTGWSAPSLRHVGRLTDDVGVVEHAELDRPRPDLGYCTDDAGRALALASRLPSDPDALRIATIALDFLRRAHAGGGVFRLRAGADGRWLGMEPSDDGSARALMGLGVAAAHAPWLEVREQALEVFDAAAGFSTSHLRARAYAILGAIEVLGTRPDHGGAARLVADATGLLPTRREDPAWPWPEPRLTYANALLPDAALAVGVAARDQEIVDAALAALGWLVDEETLADHFSFTPVGGRGPGDPRPAFDQQPVEAWAMADACARAFGVTADARWARAVRRSAGWFLGYNDTGVMMFDPTTGGGFDGLEPGGVNRNQGAESTLAFVATMAQVRGLRPPGQAVRRPATAASASRRWGTDATAAPTQRSAAP